MQGLQLLLSHLATCSKSLLNLSARFRKTIHSFQARITSVDSSSLNLIRTASLSKGSMLIFISQPLLTWHYSNRISAWLRAWFWRQLSETTHEFIDANSRWPHWRGAAEITGAFRRMALVGAGAVIVWALWIAPFVDPDFWQ